MDIKEIFNKNGILKIIFVVVSIILWMYFYSASNINFESILVFDLGTIINTLITVNFLIFLITFPITTSFIIAMSIKEDKINSIIQTSVSVFVAAIFSVALFGLGGYGLLFFLLYLLSHVLLIVLCSNQYQTSKKKSVFTIASFAGSKIALFLTIVMFIVIFAMTVPDQEQKAVSMEAGIVNLFVGDDLTKWMGTSYSISKTCTQQNISFIISTPLYEALENSSDPEDIGFVSFMTELEKEINKEKTKDELKNLFPDLNSKTIKDKVLDTIRNIPLMIVIEHYFAIVFAFIIASFIYFYFGIAFSLIGLLFTIIIFKLLPNDNYCDNNLSDIVSDDEEK